MALSSNSIMHFTKSADNLQGILKEGFKVKYCLEDVKTLNGNLHYSIPMVSFCDIPLSEIKDHITKYGGYGLGLNRDWAQTNGLNPVLYIDEKSSLGAGFHTTFYSMFRSKKVSELSDLDIKHVDVLRYMKNYQGELIRGEINDPTYRFADEKEWRYVPNNQITKQVLIKGAVLTAEIKERANAKIANVRLEFKPNDIKYIIINDESEISQFIDCIRKSFADANSYNEIERLITRIITTEQILTDF